MEELTMKKITTFLIAIAITCMFLITTVSALDLETHDFDGHFKMGVPKGASIELINDTYEEGVHYNDSKDKIIISFTDREINYAGHLPSFSVDAGTSMHDEGNYTIIECTNGTNIVALTDDSHQVRIMGEMSVNDMKSMLATAEF